MKKVLAILLMGIVCFSACKKKPENVIADILKHYDEINKKQKDYKLKHVDDITSSAGGTITGYYRDEEVKKIVSEHFTDTCRTFTDYYFDDGMLILVIRQNFAYNKPISYTEERAKEKGDSIWYDDKKTKLTISRFYFSGNKLVKWVDGDGKEVSNKSIEFINKESLIWAETIILMKELKEQ
jgi:hypothetical protein